MTTTTASGPDRLDVPAHLGVLRRYALVLARDAGDAEDLVQEALLRAVAAAHTWQPDRPVRPWLLAILHNVHASRRRRRQVEAAARGELAGTLPGASPPAQLGQVELNDTLRALLTLPQEQREVLVLVALEGLSYQEAANVLEIPLGTLMSRLGRARAALRAATSGEGGERRPPAAPPLRVVK